MSFMELRILGWMCYGYGCTDGDYAPVRAFGEYRAQKPKPAHIV